MHTFNIRTQGIKLENKIELQRSIDQYFSHSKEYYSIVNTQNNAFIYKNKIDQHLVGDINREPEINHTEFMKQIDLNSINDSEYSKRTDLIFYIFEADGIIFSNVLTNNRSNNGIEILLDEETFKIISHLYFGGDTNLFQELILSYMNKGKEVINYQEMTDVGKDYLSKLIVGRTHTKDDLLSFSHINKDDIHVIKIYKS